MWRKLCITWGGGQLHIRKSLKLYIVFYRNTMKNIKISLNKIWYIYTALIPTSCVNIENFSRNSYFSSRQQKWCFLYSTNFDSNVLVEQMIKILGKDARFIVKCPFCFNVLFQALKFKIQKNRFIVTFALITVPPWTFMGHRNLVMLVPGRRQFFRIRHEWPMWAYTLKKVPQPQHKYEYGRQKG